MKNLKEMTLEELITAKVKLNFAWDALFKCEEYELCNEVSKLTERIVNEQMRREGKSV